MNDKYMQCYLAGRYEDYEGEVAVDDIVKKVRAGTPLRDVALTVARTAITHEMDASVKVQWLKDNLDEIKTMGGDTEKSWRLYVQGRIDALAHRLEDDALNSIDDEEEDEEEEDDGEDDEDEEEEDEDDEDDEDEA
jgi:hypothetical protein